MRRQHGDARDIQYMIMTKVGGVFAFTRYKRDEAIVSLLVGVRL